MITSIESFTWYSWAGVVLRGRRLGLRPPGRRPDERVQVEVFQYHQRLHGPDEPPRVQKKFQLNRSNHTASNTKVAGLQKTPSTFVFSACFSLSAPVLNRRIFFST